MRERGSAVVEQGAEEGLHGVLDEQLLELLLHLAQQLQRLLVRVLYHERLPESEGLGGVLRVHARHLHVAGVGGQVRLGVVRVHGRGALHVLGAEQHNKNLSKGNKNLSKTIIT